MGPNKHLAGKEMLAFLMGVGNKLYQNIAKGGKTHCWNSDINTLEI